VSASRETRIQLCGDLLARIQGEKVHDGLPGRQGRLLFTYLVLNRTRPSARWELAESIWPVDPPAAPENALRALLSKLRSVLGSEVLDGRSSIRLCLPEGSLVDIEAARAAIHRAESALARGTSSEAWGPAQVALFTARRGFLPDEQAPWTEDVRNELDDLHLRALEAYGTACLDLGGTELPAAERSGRELVRLAPFRESGHRVMIEALAAQGNTAEALLTYERLRELLRRELGIAPGAELRQLHARLLATA
jgi:DNA-binding SARP family transcriptional activator